MTFPTTLYIVEHTPNNYLKDCGNTYPRGEYESTSTKKLSEAKFMTLKAAQEQVKRMRQSDRSSDMNWTIRSVTVTLDSKVDNNF